MSLLRNIVVILILVGSGYLIIHHIQNTNSSETFENDFNFMPELSDNVEHMTPEPDANTSDSNQPEINTQEPSKPDDSTPSTNNNNAGVIDSNCDCNNTLNSKDLLPNNPSTDWNSVCQGSSPSQIDPTPHLTDPFSVSMPTLNTTLRNANQQLRSEPPNPQMQVSPWIQSTINPDLFRAPLEIGNQM